MDGKPGSDPVLFVFFSWGLRASDAERVPSQNGDGSCRATNRRADACLAGCRHTHGIPSCPLCPTYAQGACHRIPVGAEGAQVVPWGVSDKHLDVRAVLKKPRSVLRTALKDSPPGPHTASCHPPTAANRHQTPTANRYQPPPIVNCQPPTAINRHQSSTANHQLLSTATNRQPPTANRCQAATTIHRQLPTSTNRQPRTANRQPLKSRRSHDHEAESVAVNVPFCWYYEGAFFFPLRTALLDVPGSR